MTESSGNSAPGEFELIERYFTTDLARARGVAVGVGDDCALLELPPNSQLAVSMDTLVGGVHFPLDGPVDLIAERALRVNLSDLAAAGADPLWFTLALTLPDSNPTWLRQFADGLLRVANEFGIALVGGDTTRGPLSVTLQVHGSVPAGQALLRGGGAEGDRVFVSGFLGDGGAALALIQGTVDAADQQREYLCRRFYQPHPQLQAGIHLRGLASAAIDVSDGLLADLGHICRRSGVGAALQWSKIPVSACVRGLFPVHRQQQFALAGGDDYQLCFTVPRHRLDDLQALVESGVFNAWEIGVITADHGVTCFDGEQPLAPVSSGYQHFAASGTGVST